MANVQGFNTLANLLAHPTAIGSGKQVMAGGHWYQVAAASAANPHFTTAGGSKLFVLPDGGFFNVMAFGAKADGVADDYPVVMKAIASAGSAAIYFPDGVYRIGQTIELKEPVRLVGHTSGMSWDSRAELRFPANATGIVINRHNTGPGAGAADCARLEGLKLTGGGGTDREKAGIWFRARGIVENCFVQKFSGDGIKVVADTLGTGDAQGNANCWQISQTSANENGRHGIFTQGGDSNAGTCTGCDFSYNGGWGVYENSFLGNTWIGLHVDSNVAGSYWAAGASQAGVFVGCYEESGHAPAMIGGRNLVLGGMMSNGTWAHDGNRLSVAAVSVPGATLGGNPGNGDILRWSDEWRLRKIGNDFVIDHMNAGSRQVAFIHGETAMYPWTMSFPSLVIGSDTPRRHSTAASAPTSGGVRGDVVYNANPVAGGMVGWVCVAPGTWKAFGEISA